MGLCRVSAPCSALLFLAFLHLRIQAKPSSQKQPLLFIRILQDFGFVAVFSTHDFGAFLTLQGCANLAHKEALRRCCLQCPPGYRPKTACPLDLDRDCAKIPCEPEYYLNQQLVRPRCEACVKCTTERHLLERSACTQDTGRVCECESGRFCQTPVANSCARCTPHRSCKPGFGVRTKGTAENDTECEECPPGTFSNEDSSIQPCNTHTNCTRLNKISVRKGNATHDERCANQPSVNIAGISLGTSPLESLGNIIKEAVDTLDSGHLFGDGATTVRKPTDALNASLFDITIEKTWRRGEHDFTLLGVLFLLGLMLCACAVMLWRRRACHKWTVPYKVKLSKRAKICAKQMNMLSSAENHQRERETMNIQLLTEECNGSSLLEMEEPLELDPVGTDPVQADGGVSGESPPQCTNCIEKIYIMRADTVIVGSVSEVPSGKNCAVRDEDGSSGMQKDVEEKEVTIHFPEQETELCLGSDITTPVEEEWEFHYSAEETLVI
ncbi:tumor necrosis factor receptor superfamily member 8 [Sceloporus undulatus]|uniref:tumor necrosis factor receptor superfamily member 8 n=1 Tax=Sceloporus undulatus TaxID=8520 RepID=UPI001C4B5F88|nr:tumor necrosis factor receptor superfamily member 8 [Sceloporus undulatus]